MRIFDFGGEGRDDLRIVQVKSHGETNHFKVVPNHEQHLITHIIVYAHSFEDGFRYLHAPLAMSLDPIGFAEVVHEEHEIKEGGNIGFAKSLAIFTDDFLLTREDFV